MASYPTGFNVERFRHLSFNSPRAHCLISGCRLQRKLGHMDAAFTSTSTFAFVHVNILNASRQGKPTAPPRRLEMFLSLKISSLMYFDPIENEKTQPTSTHLV